MGTLLRALGILNLLDSDKGEFTLEDVVESQNLTQSTAYRYLKDLIASGLLASAGGKYRLGPRIIELERIHALTNPLVLAGRSLIVPEAGDNSVHLISTIFNDKALCILKIGPDHIGDHLGNPINVLRQQGSAFALFHGAASHAMLAYLPTAKLKNLYLEHMPDIEKHRLGTSWAEFRTALSLIRSNGHALVISRDPQRLSGLAVPIHSDQGKLLGSLSMAFAAGAPGEPEDLLLHVERLRNLAAQLAGFSPHLS